MQRSGYDFFPHPQKGRSLDSYLGPLRLGAANGSLCITASGASAATVGPHAVPSLALTLEPCTAGTASQQWALAHWNISPQRVVHHGSGYCLDIPAATASGKAEAGLPVMAVPCNVSSAVQARWQLGLSGALIAQGAKMSVAAEPSQRVQQHQTGQ